jgi:iron complex outermembrane receptor protein
VCPGQTTIPDRPPDTIIVTGTYEPIPLEDSDRSVTVAPLDPASRILFNDPTGLLRLDSSVDLEARGPNNTQTDISIRGGTFGQTLVLWNGLRLNDVQTGHFNLDTPVPLESIERVEVLKGAGSTLYGSDAVGGVVNFVSQPPEIDEVRLRLAVGNFGVNEQHLEISLVRFGWSEEIAADRDFSSGFRPDRDYRNLSIASVTHHVGRLGATDIMLAISDRPYGADQFYGDYPSWERTKSWFAGVHQSLGESTEVDFSYRRHTDLFVLYRDDPALFTNRSVLDTWEFALRRRHRLSRNTTLHYGTDGSYDSIDSSNLGIHARGRVAGYGSVDFRALRRLSLNLGAREEVYRGLLHQFSPSITGGFWLSPKLRLRGGSSHAFRLPSFTDLYYSDPANVGSPNLKPEQAWSHEAAVEWRPTSDIMAETAVFQRRESNDIDYFRASPDDIWRAANLQSLRATGVETSVHARLRKAGELTVSYTALRLRTDSPAGLLSKYTSNYPMHDGVVSYQALLGRLAMLRTRFGAIQRSGEDPYVLWDVGVARPQGRIRPYVQFANLTNTSYQEIPGVVMPGRSVIGGVELQTRLK